MEAKDLKFGDIVKIVKLDKGFEEFFTVGKLAKVVEIDNKISVRVMEIDNPYRNKGWWIPPEWLELVTKDEV